MKTVIEMAREAGITFPPMIVDGVEYQYRHVHCNDSIGEDEAGCIEIFATLVKAAHTAELLEGVEMPFEYCREDRDIAPSRWHTPNQLRETVAAAVLREQRKHCACVFKNGKNTEKCKLHGAWCDTLHEQGDYRRERDALKAAHVDKLLEGVEMPETVAYHYCVINAFGHPVWDVGFHVPRNAVEENALINAYQLRETVAAAVLRKDADLQIQQKQTQHFHDLFHFTVAERDALTGAIGAKQLADFVAKHGAQEKAEPVAWMAPQTGSVASAGDKAAGYVLQTAFSVPLYAAPQSAAEPQYLSIERVDGFPEKLEQGPQPLLYSDGINGCMVRRDDVWLALTSQLAMPQSAQSTSQPLTDEQKLKLVTNWFAEDWAIKNALGLLHDYDIEAKIGAKP